MTRQIIRGQHTSINFDKHTERVKKKHIEQIKI